MATLFYIILVFFSDKVDWSWGWLVISFLFDGGERIIYKYTTDESLDGEEE